MSTTEQSNRLDGEIKKVAVRKIPSVQPLCANLFHMVEPPVIDDCGGNGFSSGSPF